MKPITADNAEGRSLLALRAGPMTPTEISARVGQSVPGWLVKAGYVTQDDSYYRITEAGRAACPYRNPLAAPGGVQPATYKPETPMPKGEVKTTQRETLALIKAAGAEGITRKKLVESIDASEQSVDNHIWALNRDGAIFKPKVGLLVAIEFKQAQAVPQELARIAMPPAGKPMHATREAVLAYLQGKQPMAPAAIAAGIGCDYDSTRAVLAGLYASMRIDRANAIDSNDHLYFIGIPFPAKEAESSAQEEPAIPSSPAEKQEVAEPIADINLTEDLGDMLMPEEAFETIEVKGIPDRRGPAVILVEHEEDFEIGIFSDSTMTLVWEDGINAATIEFCPEAVKKMRRFLGLFAEAM